MLWSHIGLWIAKTNVLTAVSWHNSRIIREPKAKGVHSSFLVMGSCNFDRVWAVQFMGGTFEGLGAETLPEGTYMGSFKAGQREGVGEAPLLPFLCIT